MSTSVADMNTTQLKAHLEQLQGRMLAQFRAELAQPGLAPAIRADREGAIRMLETGCSADDARAWVALNPAQRAIVSKLNAVATAGGEFTPEAARARLAAKRARR